MSIKKSVKFTVFICFLTSNVWVSCASNSANDNLIKKSHKMMLSKGVVEPQNADEKTILNHIPSLNDGEKRIVGSLTLIVLRTYHAASGRTCKSLSIVAADKKESQNKTVCKVDNAWKYMPQVVYR